MSSVRMLWGPASVGVVSVFSSAIAGLALSSTSRAVGWVFNIPRDGTIDGIGYLTTTKAGTPVAHNVGIFTVDSSGRPTTTAYGGSAAKSVTPTASSGWTWVTLTTTATAAAGDWAAVQIYPTGAADISNYIGVAYEQVANIGGTSMYNNGGWLANAIGTNPLAIRYSDGTVYGLALSSTTAHVIVRSNTTPDEVGCKFTLPANMTVYGAKVHATPAGWGSSAAVDVVLYDGSGSTVASATIGDKDYVDDVSPINVFWDAANLTAGSTYRLVVKPTVSTNGDMYVPKYSFDSTTALAALPCGDTWQYTSRTDAGAWTDDNVSICPFGLWVSDIDFTGGTVTTIFEGGPLSAEFPSSNFPAITPVNGRVALAFDASTDEACYWNFICPQGGIGTTLTCVVYYAMASATSGAVYWQAALEAVTPGDSLDLDATTSFDTANSGNGTVPGTAGYMQSISITMTNKDSIAAGDLVWLKLNRDADNASDTATGDAHVYRVELRSA